MVGQVCRTGLTTVEGVIDFSIFDRGGLTPKPKVTKSGDDLLSTYIYHPTKFQRDRANGLRDMHYQSFSLFGLRGANPWAKVHQKGRRPGGHRDLPSCKISSLYVNPRRRYPLPKFCGQTNRQRYIPAMPIGMWG